MVTKTHGRSVEDESIGTADLEDGAVTAAKLSDADPAASRSVIGAAALGANAYTDSQTIVLSDNDVGEGPLLNLERVSTSPAAADLIGAIPFKGRNSASLQTNYAKIGVRIEDPTDGSEDAVVLLATRIAGALATRFLLGAGFYAQGLSDPGAGIVNANGLQIAGAALSMRDYLEYRDEKAAGTDGGGFTSGAWQTRDINTEAADAGAHGSVAANQITLAAGTYECDIEAPAGVVESHQAKLYNVTAAADVLIGTSEYTTTANAVYSKSRITGRFTVASTSVFEVRHQCQTTKATDGFGSAANFGVSEVYTVARFWKVG